MFKKDNLINYFKSNIFNKNNRNSKIKVQIIYTLFIKGVSIITGFIFIPLLINYLGKEEYGFWLTLSAFYGWIVVFDIGLGNGLRNKFAEAIALKKIEQAKSYVSTAYISLFFIMLIFYLIFIVLSSYINWQAIFNTYTISADYLRKIVNFVILFFSLRFFLQLITALLYADQSPAIPSLLNVIANVLSLALIIIVKSFIYHDKLLYVSLILSFVPVFVFFIANFILFFYRFRLYLPSPKHFEFQKVVGLFYLSIKFFIFHIYGIILVSSTNLLISQFINPSEVPVYVAGQKYFSVVQMLYGIILTPIWSATTEAFALNDFDWIKNIMKKLYKLSGLLIGLTFILLVFSDYLYKIWLGNSIQIPFIISLLLALQSIIYVLFSPYVSFLNGVSKLNMNLLLIPLNIMIFMPLAYLFCVPLKMGISGLILAGIIAEIPLRIVQPIQYKKIINKTAYGIWNK